MAYVRPVGKKWKCEVSVKTPAGYRKESRTLPTEAQAHQWGREREEELAAMAGGGFPRTTVRRLMHRWRDEVAPGRSGSKWDINRINQLVGLLEDMGLADLDLSQFGPREMASVRRRRLGEVSPPSVKREETLLKSIWASARHPDWALTDVDPFKDLGPVRGSHGVARRRKAEWQELKRLLRQTGYSPLAPASTKTAEVGLAILVALRTTLRSQEVLQLGDDCLDLGRMLLSIPQHKTRYVTNRDKVVPLPPKALVLLARKCIGRGRYFSIKPSSRDTLYRRARDLAGVDGLNFHDLKRTAILQLKQRLTEDELMAVTGNSDVEVLRRHYMSDTAANASKAIWRALGGERYTSLARSIIESRQRSGEPAT